jgi:2-polyprenyl-6-hydroxyphenyl methylase/3-demethylubiquinone-9 3-methyltransferase
MILGPLFPVVGGYYRAFFLDVDQFVAALPRLPERAAVLDVGGGDGAVIDLLLERHPSARATMLDLAPNIGGSIRDRNKSRVEFMPMTTLSEYVNLRRPAPDYMIISDVIHHIPVLLRQGFAADAAAAAGPNTTIIIKEVQATGAMARIAYLADRYVSGDRNVSFLTPETLKALVAVKGFRPITYTELDTLNYFVEFEKSCNAGDQADRGSNAGHHP